mgnify:CR=1 FL=1
MYYLKPAPLTQWALNSDFRECWCAQNIAGIAEKLDDKECSFPCEGNSTMACGGNLKLSVYRISGGSKLVAAPILLAMSGMLMAWMY